MKLYDTCVKCGRDGHNSAGCKVLYPVQNPSPSSIPSPAPFVLDPKTVLPVKK